MKNIVLITVSLLLIITKADTDTCTTYTTEATCKEGTKCAWTATGKCKGDTGATCSAKTKSDECTVTTYSESKKCTYTEESTTGTCAKPTQESELTCTGSTKTACTGVTGCVWTPSSVATCTGDSTCTAAASSKTTCEGTSYSKSSNCAWEAGTCASETNNDNGDGNGGDDDSSFGLKFSGLIYLLFTLF